MTWAFKGAAWEGREEGGMEASGGRREAGKVGKEGPKPLKGKERRTRQRGERKEGGEEPRDAARPRKEGEERMRERTSTPLQKASSSTVRSARSQSSARQRTRAR